MLAVDVAGGGPLSWARLAPFDATPDIDIAIHTGVQPGDTVEFGPPPVTHAVRATMTISGTVPAGAEEILAHTTCPGPQTGDVTTIMFDDRCGTTADVLLLAIHLVNPTNEIVGYIHIPAQPLVDGGTIMVDPNAWLPPEQITIHFANAPDLTAPTNLVFVGNSFGVHASPGPGSDASTLAVTMPAVGALGVNGRLRQDST